MFDAVLRPIKARAYAPLARRLRRIPPDAITAAGGLVGAAAAVAAAAGRLDVALAAWLLNRALDGLDGEVARAAGRAPSPAGAYLDLMVDLVVYTTLPLGIATGIVAAGVAGAGAIWPATAALLGAFYLNLGSWALLAAATQPAAPSDSEAVEPHHDATDPHRGATGARRIAPGLPMPTGFIEGGETVVAFTLVLALPQHAAALLAAFALLTVIGALDRTLRALPRLRAPTNER